MRTLIIWVCSCLCLVCFPSWAVFENTNTASFSNQTRQFVTVNEAFPLTIQQDNDELQIDWNIKLGYYLYQSRIKLWHGNKALNITLPQGTPYHDEFFGDVTIYTSPLNLFVSLTDLQAPTSLTLEYQGCAKAGLCYPPEQRTIEIAPFSNANNSTGISEQQSLADSLDEQGWALALFFLLGIGLAFTPCVFPMYPILTSIALGSKALTRKKALWLSFSYVQGMAITYSLLGLIVASAGIKFQAMLQSPIILIIASLIFVLLSLSMFGLYTLQMPSSLQSKLNQWSANFQGGSTISVFLMGAISGLICSPCTTAPLSGALLYVAQSGDLLTGAMALYLLSLGMGVPLVIVAVFGQHLLPKSGEWMNKIKVLFGFILLAAPIFLLERITPSWLSDSLWTTLGVTSFAWLYWQKNRLPFGGWKQTGLGVIAVLGIVASIKPVLPYILNSTSHAIVQNEATLAPSLVSFERIETIEDLEDKLALAKTNQQPVMLDLYADWCVACKEFEHKTFSDQDVASTLSKFMLIQADVTKSRANDFALLEHLNVLGLPTIVFWDAQGKLLPSARVTGFMDADKFQNHLSQPALSTQK